MIKHVDQFFWWFFWNAYGSYAFCDYSKKLLLSKALILFKWTWLIVTKKKQKQK